MAKFPINNIAGRADLYIEKTIKEHIIRCSCGGRISPSDKDGHEVSSNGKIATDNNARCESCSKRARIYYNT